MRCRCVKFREGTRYSTEVKAEHDGHRGGKRSRVSHEVITVHGDETKRVLAKASAPRKAAETAEAAAWKSDEQKAFRRKKNQIKRKVSKLRLAQR